jgi:hypothetical protein
LSAVLDASVRILNQSTKCKPFEGMAYHLMALLWLSASFPSKSAIEEKIV